ncbi:MAG: SAM-dependent methyltransferase [Cyanobacteria bacterium J06634_5]
MDTFKNLNQAITHRIEQSEQGRITFAEFMALALYQPEFGYYAANKTKTQSGNEAVIGPQGDFVTSPHMGHDFGELLAEQFFDMWQGLGQPEGFTLVEAGAGQGLIASDAIAHIHHHYPDLAKCFDYVVIERSPTLRAEQQQRLSHWQARGLSIRWQTLEDLANQSIVGCVFSNELLDAFPVHWVERHNQVWREMWVANAERGFVPVLESLSTPKIEDYLQHTEIDFDQGYVEGYRTEVNLAALDWLEQISQKLNRGYVLTIDYGYSAQRYYSPARREGTLQCYYQHNHHNDLFAYVGQQDITAHVNFTALERHGDALGLEKIGFTQQGLFLMALGLGDRLATIAQPGAQPVAASKEQAAKPIDIQSIMRRREALQQLISPMGLGNFGVLIQGKGLMQKEIARPLKGLTIPPLM